MYNSKIDLSLNTQRLLSAIDIVIMTVSHSYHKVSSTNQTRAPIS